MLSTLARLMLTASSIAPVGFTYSWVAWMQGNLRVALYSAIAGAVAVILCVIVLSVSRSQLESMPFKSKEIEAVDAENIGFMLLYLLPLFTEKISSLNWAVWIPTILVYVATGYGYHFNPLLGLLRWHFYKITSTDGVKYVLITKKHIRSASQTISVGQLTEYILIDLGRA